MLAERYAPEAAAVKGKAKAKKSAPALSTTMSTPTSDHGIWAGSRSENTLMLRPSTTKSPLMASVLPG